MFFNCLIWWKNENFQIDFSSSSPPRDDENIYIFLSFFFFFFFFFSFVITNSCKLSKHPLSIKFKGTNDSREHEIYVYNIIEISCETCMVKNLDHHLQQIHSLHDLGQVSWSSPHPSTASPSFP